MGKGKTPKQLEISINSLKKKIVRLQDQKKRAEVAMKKKASSKKKPAKRSVAKKTGSKKKSVKKKPAKKSSIRKRK